MNPNKICGYYGQTAGQADGTTSLWLQSLTELEQVDSHKLLVVTIDNQLTLPLTNILMIYARS